VKIRNDEAEADVWVVIESMVEEVAAINQDIQLLRYRHPMAIEDFLNPADENIVEEADLTNEEILEIVRSLETNIAENEDDSSELPTVSVKEAMESFDKVIKFFLEQEDDYSREMDGMVRIGRVLRKLKENLLVQRCLNGYFKNLGSSREKEKVKLV